MAHVSEIGNLPLLVERLQNIVNGLKALGDWKAPQIVQENMVQPTVERLQGEMQNCWDLYWDSSD